MKLVNLDCFYDWLDMICIIIWTRCSFSPPLPPANVLPIPSSPSFITSIGWGEMGHRVSTTHTHTHVHVRACPHLATENTHLTLYQSLKRQQIVNRPLWSAVADSTLLWRHLKDIFRFGVGIRRRRDGAENWELTIQSDPSTEGAGAHKWMHEEAWRVNQWVRGPERDGIIKLTKWWSNWQTGWQTDEASVWIKPLKCRWFENSNFYREKVFKLRTLDLMAIYFVTRQLWLSG